MKILHQILVVATAIATAIATATAALTAQQNIVYPPGTQTGTGTNAFPFGSPGIRYQKIYPGSVFSNKPAVIRDLFVMGGTSSLEAVYDDIEIRMGVTQLKTEVSDWSKNNPKPTTVYRGALRARFAAGKWSAIGLPKEYFFIPLSTADNLCVEVIVWKASSYTGNFYLHGAGDRSTIMSRAFLNQWTSNQNQAALVSSTGGAKLAFLVDSGNFVVAGTGCKSSSATQLTISADTWPQPGKSITIRLRGAKASSSGLLVAGLDHEKWNSTPLPMDLAILNAPGCFIWNHPLASIGVATNAAGAIDLKLPVPKTAVSGTVFAHWWVLDPKANNFGLTTSDYATVILGR